jgi:hypothetical protein
VTSQPKRCHDIQPIGGVRASPFSKEWIGINMVAPNIAILIIGIDKPGRSTSNTHDMSNKTELYWITLKSCGLNSSSDNVTPTNTNISFAFPKDIVTTYITLTSDK